MKKKNHKITKITNDFDTQTMAAPQDERLPFLYLSFFAASSSLKKLRPICFALVRRMGAKRSNSVCSIHLYNVGKSKMLCEVKDY